MIINTYPEMNEQIKKLLRLDPNNSVDLYAAARIEELEAEIDRLKHGWIRVKDRLPDDDTQVLAVDRYGDQEVVLFVDGYFQPDYIGEVTHWMPLPKPPKGEDNE